MVVWVFRFTELDWGVLVNVDLFVFVKEAYLV